MTIILLVFVQNKAMQNSLYLYMQIMCLYMQIMITSVHFHFSGLSSSLRLHGLQHARLHCPSQTHGAYSNSCPSSWWCHPKISSSVHGIFQTKLLEQVAISFSRGYSWPRDRTHVSCISWRILYHWPPGKPSHFEKLQIKRKLNYVSTNQNAQLPSATRFKLLKTLNCHDLQNRPLITFSETNGILNT